MDTRAADEHANRGFTITYTHRHPDGHATHTHGDRIAAATISHYLSSGYRVTCSECGEWVDVTDWREREIC